MVLALLVGLAALTPAKLEAKSMNVLTFNIRYANPDDGDNRWESRRELVASVIRDARADLIGLQEALRSQLDDLRADLPEFAEVGVGRDDGKSAGEFSAILYRAKRFKLLDQGSFWFSDSPETPGSIAWGARIPRICTWARLQDLSTKGTFYAYNLHLDHESQESRSRSVNLLLSRVMHRENPDPSVVLGDFNAAESNDAIQNMLGRLKRGENEPADTLWWPYWIDAYRQINAKVPNEGTYHGFSGKASPDRIDYIFVSPEWTVTQSQILRTSKGGRFPSDHFPVSATIQLEP